ncbi:D-3-phosphoglycerate dehydrogenase [Tenacibaculum sp. MAR_2009_124]|uniref:NAD(P)-dependent oxidoreductase n=1 Tax=Tenacibaculum sp. MAR_2009_124 TaxID=1250059 RepID=UPI00089941B3|nr:NAD(P)-dependent oxidoreductase [Tenacibaculum sp. MAR_2009_124]SEB38935.1 D-3-phosphoglycerate dehydrogenase [Tenacibaculum sp. MAR_2009_124]
MKILANDGISQSGIAALENGGFEVITTKVAQNQLDSFINENGIDALLVANNTQVRQELIEDCPSLKLIGKAGVNFDNIDVDFARENGLHVINTPEAISGAVAELIFAHIFGMARFLHQSNREMPLEGETRFNALRKQFANGVELKGKTIGIIGNNETADEVAKIALGVGMKVLFAGNYSEEKTIALTFYNGQTIDFTLDTEPFKEVLKKSDFISIHTPLQDGYLIGTKEFEHMKQGIGIINVSNGGLVDEVALVNAIKDGTVKYAALDVFENQPTPEIQLLMNPEISFTPNIASSTVESKQRVDEELAKQITELLSE